jgi:hypothetical protein
VNTAIWKTLNREPLTHTVREKAHTSHFPLSAAYLCQDCNAVGNNASRCPACYSRVLMGLSSVLNREEEVKVTSVENSYQKHLDTHPNPGYSVSVSQ